MTRQLITALIITVTTTFAASTVEAGDCHAGFRIHSHHFHGFHARFGCSPRAAFLIFQQRPELITRFPEAARLVETQFGALTAPALAPAIVATPAIVGTQTIVGTGAAVVGTGTAVVNTGAAAVDTIVTGIPANTAAVTGITTDVAATAAPLEGAGIVAPNTAAPVVSGSLADPNAPPADLPLAAPIQSELEPLLGLWINENDAADQPIAKINLNNDGNAIVTVNTALGQTEITKPFAIEDDSFKLDGNELAKVVSADANKVVLDAGGTNLTFIRP